MSHFGAQDTTSRVKLGYRRGAILCVAQSLKLTISTWSPPKECCVRLGALIAMEAMDEFRRNFEVPVVMASTHFAQNPRKVNCSNSASIMKCLSSMQALRSFANKSMGAGYNPAFRLAPRKPRNCILGKLCSVVFLQVSLCLQPC